MMLSSLVFGGMNSSANAVDYDALDKLSSKDLARAISNEIAKNFPMNIDYLTKAIGIVAINTTVITKKQINIAHKDLKEHWEKDKNNLIIPMFKLDSQNICYNPVWEYMINKRGIIAKFEYVSTNNKPIFEYTVEKEDCRKLK